MTYHFKHILEVIRLKRTGVKPGSPPPETFLARLYTWTIGCHLSHRLDFVCALLCYYLCFLPLFDEAKTLSAPWNPEGHWILKVVAFNVAIGWTLNAFWHWMTYAGPFGWNGSKPLREVKFNPSLQYGEGKANMVSSSTGHLEREMAFNTLGWVQSALWQCCFMHLWASGALPYYNDFWSRPAWSLMHLAMVTYWREFHFYWVHRFMHPWGVKLPGIGDPGRFIYMQVHRLHHRSESPGPWSGLSMHPVEHLLYYSCTLLPLFFEAHPLHHLYAKFHADVAPIAGHDGYAAPAGNSDYHYLHHAIFDCNYGVPLMDFDKMFGSWITYSTWKKHRKLKYG